MLEKKVKDPMDTKWFQEMNHLEEMVTIKREGISPLKSFYHASNDAYGKGYARCLEFREEELNFFLDIIARIKNGLGG